jgi:hypothetical protein
MATAAFCLSIIANFRCNLLKVSNDAFQFDTYTPQSAQSFGLWCYTAENGVLYDISGYEGDSKFEAARGKFVTCTEKRQ